MNWFNEGCCIWVIKIKSIQKWIPIEKILDKGIIKIEKNKYIKILKIIPINFNLKSELEKESILESYKLFLRTCNFDIQILIQSKNEDLSKYFNVLKEISQKEKNEKIIQLTNEYIDFIMPQVYYGFYNSSFSCSRSTFNN